MSNRKPFVQHMNRYRTAAWLLLLIGAAVVWLTPLRDSFLAQAMIFTQKSPQTLAGALRAAQGGGLLYAFFLAAFRALFLPWLPQMLPIADTMVFGTAGGIAASWLGNLAASALCFVLSQILAGAFLQKLLPNKISCFLRRGGSVGCCVVLLLFPWAGGIAGYLLGMSGLPFRRFLAGAAVGELVAALAYGLCCSPYSAALPNKIVLWMRAAALVLALTAALFPRIDTKIHTFFRR